MLTTSHPSPVPATQSPNGAKLVRPGGRESVVVVFEETVVDFFVQAADLLGVPKSVAAIYGVCFSSAEPLSFADIEARLDLSAGSISQGLRVLREVGALKAVRGERDRRESFVPDLEMRKVIERWLAERLQRQLVSGRDRLEAMEKAVPGGSSASVKVLRDRMKYLGNWHGKASALLPIVRAFLKVN